MWSLSIEAISDTGTFSRKDINPFTTLSPPQIFDEKSEKYPLTRENSASILHAVRSNALSIYTPNRPKQCLINASYSAGNTV